MTELKVDWCSYKAAKYAVMNWHYSKAMPSGKLVKFGVWENSKYIGCVLFGRGSSRYMGKEFGLQQTECTELVRVALSKHLSTVSRIVSLAVGMFRVRNAGIRLLISYADPEQGHNGSIYQSMNWLYVGTVSTDWIYLNGSVQSPRSISSHYGTRALPWLRKHIDPNARFERLKPKHKYLYPLDRKMRRQIEPLAQPYPKRELRGQSVKGDAAGFQSAEEGSIPSVRSSVSVEGE